MEECKLRVAGCHEINETGEDTCLSAMQFHSSGRCNGNVGIGTDLSSNNQGYKLSVNGFIRCKALKVEPNWSYFVFEKNYHLLTLQEVEKYVQANGHLPEIPSAKEVDENGIEVGEMNAKLLQKIEVLTLYSIQLQKQIDELKKNNK